MIVCFRHALIFGVTVIQTVQYQIQLLLHLLHICYLAHWRSIIMYCDSQVAFVHNAITCYLHNVNKKTTTTHTYLTCT